MRESPESWQPERITYLQSHIRKYLGSDAELAPDLAGLETQWSAVHLSVELTEGKDPTYLPQTTEGIIEGLVEGYRRFYFEKTLVVRGLRAVEKIPVIGPLVGRKTDEWATRRENIQRQRSTAMYSAKNERRNKPTP